MKGFGMTTRYWWIAIASVVLSGPAIAQENCTPPTSVDAGLSATDAPTFKAGESASVMLRPISQVHLRTPSHNADKPQSFGGVILFTVQKAGTWRVGLGGGAWISVRQKNTEVASSAHRHGEQCIVKMVDFPLRPGRAIIELSAASLPHLRVDISPVKP